MATRICFLLITAFWVTMNVLLLRFETGGEQRTGGRVPLDLVIGRILTSPDTSSLEVTKDGTSVGFCRFASTIVEPAGTGKTVSGPPEGMVTKREGYSIDLEGNLALGDFDQRLRFDVNLKLSRDRKWTEFSARLNVQPTVLELKAVAAEGVLEIRWTQEGVESRQTVRLGDVADSRRLMEGLAGPMVAGLMHDWGLLLPSASMSDLALGLQWEARHDWIEMGSSTVRVYRLETRLLDRWEAAVLVSRVGEILSIQLPNGVRVENDGLTRLDTRIE